MNIKLLTYDPNAKSRIQCNVEDMLRTVGVPEETLERLAASGYYKAPASKGHHLARPGGLALHSLHVTNRLIKISLAFDIPWEREAGPVLVGLLHDLVKTQCYEEMPFGYEYREPNYPGHGFASVCIAEDLGFSLEKDEKLAIIHHMGAFGLDSKELKALDAATDIRRGSWPAAVMATHFSDWYASRIDDEEVDRELF